MDRYRYRWIYTHLMVTTKKKTAKNKEKKTNKQKQQTKRKEIKRGKEEKNYKSSQKTMNKCIPIHEYFKCKWTKAPIKTQGGRVGKKKQDLSGCCL